MLHLSVWGRYSLPRMSLRQGKVRLEQLTPSWPMRAMDKVCNKAEMLSKPRKLYCAN